MSLDLLPLCRSHWVCKKHGAVSHSSTEAEVIALDASIRLEGLPALMLWDVIKEVLGMSIGKIKQQRKPKTHRSPNIDYDKWDRVNLSDTARYNNLVKAMIDEIDYVPPSARLSSGEAELYVFEDNEAVIKMCIKREKPYSSICSQNTQSRFRLAVRADQIRSRSQSKICGYRGTAG